MTAGPALRIVQVGFATTVQDHGRTGLAHLGVPTAGAVDRHTHDLMNRLVGNPLDAATIETMGALVVEALRPVVVARSTDSSRHTLVAGDRFRVDAPFDSVWAYLSVRGGVDVEPVLGSRSVDTLGHLGPPPFDGRPDRSTSATTQAPNSSQNMHQGASHPIEACGSGTARNTTGSSAVANR